MKCRNLAIVACALLFGCVGFACVSQAQTSKSSNAQSSTKTTTTKAAIHHEWGTIDSVSDTSLVLDHTWKGKKEQTNFTLNSGTKKEGTLDKGAHATVFYEMKDKDRVATEVKVSAMKSASTPKKS